MNFTKLNAANRANSRKSGTNVNAMLAYFTDLIPLQQNQIFADICCQRVLSSFTFRLKLNRLLDQ